MIRHETESQRSAEGTAHSSNQRSYNAVLAIHLLGRGGRPDVFGNASYSWAEFNGQPCPSILSVLSWPIILKSIFSQVHFSGHVLFSTFYPIQLLHIPSTGLQSTLSTSTKQSTNPSSTTPWCSLVTQIHATLLCFDPHQSCLFHLLYLLS